MRILASPAFSNELVNPYNALLYGEISASGIEVVEYSHAKTWMNSFSIVHFHWPDGYINKKSLLKSLQRIVVFAISLMVAKIKGCKIVWTVHNIEPHDAYRHGLSRRFLAWFINRCDGFIFMNEESKKMLFSHFNIPTSSRYVIIPHGHYRTSYPPAVSQQQAKRIFKLPMKKNVLLCMGMIKPYKNIDSLINYFCESKLDNWVLLIAGKPESLEYTRYLEKLAFGNPNIVLQFSFIANSDIPLYLSAAEAVILPYKNIVNSGALLLALSFNKPVIAPYTGAVISFQEEVGVEWICSYQGELDAIKLINALTHIHSRLHDGICSLEKYNWDNIAQETIRFYSQLIAPVGQTDELICH